ncbi:MAG: hypothetical protein Tsb0021_02930 [Chlamydiales bacterium]
MAIESNVSYLDLGINDDLNKFNQRFREFNTGSNNIRFVLRNGIIFTAGCLMGANAAITGTILLVNTVALIILNRALISKTLKEINHEVNQIYVNANSENASDVSNETIQTSLKSMLTQKYIEYSENKSKKHFLLNSACLISVYALHVINPLTGLGLGALDYFLKNTLTQEEASEYVEIMLEDTIS